MVDGNHGMLGICGNAVPASCRADWTLERPNPCLSATQITYKDRRASACNDTTLSAEAQEPSPPLESCMPLKLVPRGAKRGALPEVRYLQATFVKRDITDYRCSPVTEHKLYGEWDQLCTCGNHAVYDNDCDTWNFGGLPLRDGQRLMRLVECVSMSMGDEASKRLVEGTEFSPVPLDRSGAARREWYVMTS